jgi:hypothetical protein
MCAEWAMAEWLVLALTLGSPVADDIDQPLQFPLCAPTPATSARSTAELVLVHPFLASVPRSLRFGSHHLASRPGKHPSGQASSLHRSLAASPHLLCVSPAPASPRRSAFARLALGSCIPSRHGTSSLRFASRHLASRWGKHPSGQASPPPLPSPPPPPSLLLLHHHSLLHPADRTD